MYKTEFSSNPNGKLFMEHFNDVRQVEQNRYFPGAEHEIWLRSYFMGIATIAALHEFQFKNIRDVFGFTIFGRPTHYTAATLKNFYKDLEPETKLTHIVWHWKMRNMPVQESLIQDWWKGVQDTNQTESAYQTALAL